MATEECKIKAVRRDKATVFLLDNVLCKEELQLFSTTFNYLKPHFLSPEYTVSAKNPDGTPAKSNKSLFVHKCTPRPLVVDLFKVRAFDILDAICNNFIQNIDSIYYAARVAPDTGHLLSYYGEEKDGYPAHQDSSLVTFLSWFDENEKNYTGGDLYLPEIDLTIESRHNTGIMIPGALHHEVKPVSIIDSNKTGGRITYSLFTLQPGWNVE